MSLEESAKIGLVNEYTTNEKIRLHIRMRASLAYLSVQHIDKQTNKQKKKTFKYSNIL